MSTNNTVVPWPPVVARWLVVGAMVLVAATMCGSIGADWFGHGRPSLLTLVPRAVVGMAALVITLQVWPNRRPQA